MARGLGVDADIVDDKVIAERAANVGKLDLDVILGFDVAGESKVDQLVRYVSLGNQIESKRD